MQKKEIFGAALLVVGIAGMFLSVRDTVPPDRYFTTTRDLAVGEIVSSSDFQVIPIDLRGAANHYISAESIFSNRQVLRKIAKGEILPRDAISKRKGLERRKQVTFTFLESKIPIGLRRGDLVDIYFFNAPRGGATDSPVQLLKKYETVQIDSVSKGEGQLNGEITVTLLVEPENVGEVLTFLASSEPFLVRGSHDGE